MKAHADPSKVTNHLDSECEGLAGLKSNIISSINMHTHTHTSPSTGLSCWQATGIDMEGAASLWDYFKSVADASHGYIHLEDGAAIATLAAFLELDADFLTEQLETVDQDHNKYITFPEFALWADRHTLSVRMGVGHIPEKKLWRVGMPGHWTTIPPPPPEMEPQIVGTRGTMQLDQQQVQQAHRLLDLAKKRRFEQLLGEVEACDPAVLNLRPEPREFGLVHHAAYWGQVPVLERLLRARADVLQLTRSNQTALDVAQKKNREEAVAFLRDRIRPDAAAEQMALRKAHEALDLAKEGRWPELYEMLQADGRLATLRPPERNYGLLHHAAFRGDLEPLQRLVALKAELGSPSKGGQSVLRVALDQGHWHAAQYLEAAMPVLHLQDEFVSFPSPELVAVDDPQLLGTFKLLLQGTHKPSENWTRDRTMATDGVTYYKKTPVPDGYEFQGAMRNENAALWRMYHICREVLKEQCQAPETNPSFKPWDAWTSRNKSCSFSGELALERLCNEWLLFHAGVPEALAGICKTGFKMAKVAKGADSEGGGLYGEGAYFTDSITKADEYARRKVASGDFAGCRSVALCRVLGGCHYYTANDVAQEEKAQMMMRVFQGIHHSVIGDRLKLKKTYREYVIYAAAQAYPEYILFYKRKFKDPAKEIYA